MRSSGLVADTLLCVALLPDEPAGAIAPRTAGVVRFEATLAWRRPEDVPPGPVLLDTPGRCSFTETEDPKAATRRLVGEIRAFTELGAALEAALRAVTTFATLTEATLEVGAVRTAAPRVASGRALERLARDLWDAGFRVRFKPSWSPAPEADVYLGGAYSASLNEFLRAHPSWSVT